MRIVIFLVRDVVTLYKSTSGPPFHRLWKDASALVKPCPCVGIFGGGTAHSFRFLLGVLHCSVFSNEKSNEKIG